MYHLNSVSNISQSIQVNIQLTACYETHTHTIYDQTIKISKSHSIQLHNDNVKHASSHDDSLTG